MLASALIQFGKWTAAQGLTFLRQIPDDARRTEAIGLIAPHLPERERRVAVEDLLSMSTHGSEAWTRALEGLAPYIPEILIPLVITAAQQTQGPWLRSRIVRAIADRIPARKLETALQIAKDTPAPIAAAQALAALVPRVMDTSRRHTLVDNVLVRLSSVPCSELHGVVLASMVPNASGADLAALLDAGRGARLPEVHVRVLEAVARQSSESERTALALEARDVTQRVAQCETRAALMTAISRLLPEPQRTEVEQEALAAIESIQDPWTRARELARHPATKTERLIELAKRLRRKRSGRRLLALGCLANRLPPKLEQSVWRFIVSSLTAADEDENSAVSNIVTALAPSVPGFALDAMIEVAHSTEDKMANFHAIAVLAARLPPLQRDAELERALRASQAIHDGESIALAAVPMVGRLDHSLHRELRAEILALACAGPVSAERQRALAENAWQLGDIETDGLGQLLGSEHALVLPGPGPGREDALTEWDYDAIIALAPHLSQAQLATVLDRIHESQDADKRSSLLVKLVPYLNTPLRDRELIELIDLITRPADADEEDAELDRADLLAKIGRWLPLEILPEAYKIVTDMDARERGLVLAEFLKGPVREHVQEPIKPLPIARTQALAAAADYLAVSVDTSQPKVAQKLYSTALKRLDSRKRRDDLRQMAVLALAELAPYVEFEEEALGSVLEFVLDMRDPEAQAEIRFKLAAALGDLSMVSDGFAALSQIGNLQRRLELMKRIAPYLRASMLADALLCVSDIDDPSIAAEVTAHLLPILDGDAYARALENGLAYAHKINAIDRKAGALTKLALNSRKPSQDTVVRETMTAAYASARDTAVHVFAQLAPLLSDTELNAAIERIGALGDADKLEHFPAVLAARLDPGQVERALALMQNSSQRWRGKVLGRLPIERLPRSSLLRVIEGALEEMSTGTRNEALRLQMTLYPALVALAGPDTMPAVARALLDVADWWP